MAAPDSDSLHDSPDSRSSDWYAQQWNALCEELGTSDPNEVLARVQTLKRQMNRSSSDQAPEEEGLVTISEVEEVFREMNRKMEKLRERNAALVERLEQDDEGKGAEGAFRDLQENTERLLETLDASTIEEARMRIQKLNRRLESLYHEKEQLVQAGLSNAGEALDELERLREERDTARHERDRLQTERDQLEQQLEETNDAPPSSTPSPDTAVLEAAVIVRDQIGVSTPAQAEALTRIVEQLHDRVRRRAAGYDVTVDDSPEDVVEMLHSMTVHLRALPDPDTLPPAAADALGASTASEARTLADTVRRVGSRLVDLDPPSIEFDDADPETDDALTLLDTLDDQLRALSDIAASPEKDTALSEAVGDILGIRTVDDARELESLITDLSDRLDRLSREHEKLSEAGLTVDTALAMIENMKAQLETLYHDAETNVRPDDGLDPSFLDEELQAQIAALTDLAPQEADDVTQLVHRLTEQLDRLVHERAPLEEAGLDPGEAVAMIENMEVQLNDLYRTQNEHTDAADRLAAIEDVLGISTREEAEELSKIARQMEEQLTALYKNKEKLNELGLSSIEDAVDMIENMETQLIDLYEDRETLRNLPASDAEEQSTFQQLQALYAEREKLQQALGVSSANDVIEMVESLNTQLDELYKGRDATVDPEERADVVLWDPEPAPSSTDDPIPHEADASLTMNSMEHQLEALYREKETLLHHGFSNAREAVTQLQTQQKQIDALQRENHAYEQRFDRLQSELGTTSVPHLVALVEALESDADVSLEEVLDTTSDTAEAIEHGVDIEAASPFVDSETIERLPQMEASELEALNAGVVRLNDDGTVEYLNEAALQLPGLPSDEDRTAFVGKNFFLELAPSTNNNLFYGRFRKGQRRGTMDARFPYTFTSPDDGPQPFDVHLHRKPDGDSTWLLFRPT